MLSYSPRSGRPGAIARFGSALPRPVGRPICARRCDWDLLGRRSGFRNLLGCHRVAAAMAEPGARRQAGTAPGAEVYRRCLLLILLPALRLQPRGVRGIGDAFRFRVSTATARQAGRMAIVNIMGPSPPDPHMLISGPLLLVTSALLLLSPTVW